MAMTKVHGLCALIECEAANFPHMWEALQVAGAIPGDNRRLALIGDAVLKLSLLNAWYPSGNPLGRSMPNSH